MYLHKLLNQSLPKYVKFQKQIVCVHVPGTCIYQLVKLALVITSIK